ncbi:BCCT family transporter [Paenibacillus sp. ACRRX]|uniref:glycine betaine uptake BCCT transporter n=1 Tax=unclassified Paenibacillus TaxID=185978 RepID=UPI001EF60AD2|nr:MULTISPECIES: BCCT family transporter [unclassified Paenibacillus]MCG7407870.1 BCCT family transporter [Paenibacillus sp. ACRRX]MDK8181013.1 BCCT family transporter [Paenibacillus sp. UMB4589-SE434]
MVFLISILIILAFVLWGLFAPQHLSETTDMALSFATNRFGWFYLIAALIILVYSLYLAFSKFGHIRLGDDDDEPEYSNMSWFAMLFSAGMGIGLVFWGVAEPISHFMTPPSGEPLTADAARTALRYSFFHWGLHPWGIYTLVSLGLAYFTFRKGFKGLISWTFYPLLGKHVNGPIGKAIDILAIIATAFGVATSLGLGAMQINGGLHHVFGLPSNITIQLVIIAVVTVLFLASSISGLDKGIRLLSNTNLLMAIGLLIITFLIGPTWFILDTFTTTLGSYLQNIIQMSLRLTPFSENSWIANWTLFYWAWWIAWAPFVGSFIARVSKGRTIKEFVLGTMLLPSGFSFIWFATFGSTALHLEIFQGKPIAAAVKADLTSALFVTLESLPGGTLLAVLATALIVTFFITSADSATFVLGMMSSDGNPDPTAGIKLTWGIFTSLIASVLLMSGGLNALQTASIMTALPFTVVLLCMIVSISRALHDEEREYRKKEKQRRKKLDELLLENNS